MLCSCSRLFKNFALFAKNGLTKFIVKFCGWLYQILPTCRALLFITKSEMAPFSKVITYKAVNPCPTQVGIKEVKRSRLFLDLVSKIPYQWLLHVIKIKIKNKIKTQFILSESYDVFILSTLFYLSKLDFSVRFFVFIGM